MSRLPTIALGCFVVGAALMLAFDAPVTRVLGVSALVAFVVCGVFAIAGPALIDHTDDEA